MTDTAADLPPEEPFPSEDLPDEVLEEHEDGFMDKVRHTGVGVEDRNIVGDVGPTDIPPGGDPDGAGRDVPWVEDDEA